MANAAGAAVSAPLLRGLPDEIVVWEILLRLPPKSILRCRAVCRAWQCATSTGDFLHAHHRCQPSLPIIRASEQNGARHRNILVFDPRAADALLQPVARLQDCFWPVASCDGLLILYNVRTSGYSVCNPVTRQHAPLPQLSHCSVLAMYAHRPTREYRLLVYWNITSLLLADAGKPTDQIFCCVLALGSDQPGRYVGRLQGAGSSWHMKNPTRLRDSLHWYPICPVSWYPICPVSYQSDLQQQYNKTGSIVVIVFDTTSESFRQMRAPDVPGSSYIFEMDATLGIHTYNEDTETFHIWMLKDYEGEVWECLYNVKLPVMEIRGQFGSLDDDWDATVMSVDGDVLLLLIDVKWIVCVDIDGKVVATFHRDGQEFEYRELWLKQTLVQHTFFKTTKGNYVNALPFV